MTQVVPVCVPELELTRVSQLLTIGAELRQAHLAALVDPARRRRLQPDTRVTLACAARFSATDLLQAGLALRMQGQSLWCSIGVFGQAHAWHWRLIAHHALGAPNVALNKPAFLLQASICRALHQSLVLKWAGSEGAHASNEPCWAPLPRAGHRLPCDAHSGGDCAAHQV